jgi:hypothetical protein
MTSNLLILVAGSTGNQGGAVTVFGPSSAIPMPPRHKLSLSPARSLCKPPMTTALHLAKPLRE